MKKIALIGSTGSIGVQTLNVVRRHPDKFKIVSLSCGENSLLLKKQIEEFPEFDFIYYFPVAINYNEQIRSIAQENNLKIVAIIDSNNSFGERNKISKKNTNFFYS